MELPITLSDLQEEGVKQLLKSKASILADPPGAGKTWTTLATLARDAKHLTRCLIVAPNQVLCQWHSEVERLIAHNKLAFNVVYPKSYAEWTHINFSLLHDAPIVMFLTPSLMTKVAKPLRYMNISHLVMDEVHLYSRPRTKGWNAIHTIAPKVSKRVLFLTANPIQNSHKELKYLYYTLASDTMLKQKADDVPTIPIVRRRPDTSYLPKRKDVTRLIEPDTNEAQAMQDMVSKARALSSTLAGMIREQSFSLSSEERQKTKAVVEDCLRLKKEGKRTLVVLHRKLHFTVLTTALKKAGLTVDIWNGSVTAKQREEKLHMWQNYDKQKCTIADILRKTKLGSVAMPDFPSLITDYAVSIPDVLLLQSRAGGVGLNLQMFHAVLLPSLDWNPCSEDQAIARVLRRGQKTETVEVVRYILNQSIDLRIMEKQQIKRKCIVEHLGNL